LYFRPFYLQVPQSGFSSGVGAQKDPEIKIKLSGNPGERNLISAARNNFEKDGDRDGSFSTITQNMAAAAAAAAAAATTVNTDAVRRRRLEESAAEKFGEETRAKVFLKRRETRVHF
jgi:hypothetical protein